MIRNMEQPRTRYAKSGDVNIAYQVMGDGPLDLIVVPGWMSNVDMHWQMLGYEAWVARMTSFCRLIVFDKRGTGLSDRDVGESTLEERMDDLRSVLDAAGSERAAVLGFSEGGSLAMLFAASYPERVHALVLFGTFPCYPAASDFPEGEALAGRLNEMIRIADEEWGEGKTLGHVSPSLAHVPAAVEFMGRFERASLSPRAARAALRWISQIDVRGIACNLHVPTLVTHRADDQLIPVAAGRWLGSNIPGARFVELPGNDHAPWSGDFQVLAEEVEELLTGSRGHAEIDRVLATVLFTDIVGSTERAVDLGDRGWQELLRRHHGLVRDQLHRYRGVEQDTAGDGFFATFDGPARAVRCAQRICEVVREVGLEVRAGVHRRMRARRREAGRDRRPHRCTGGGPGPGGRSPRVEHRARPCDGIRSRVHRARRAQAEGRPGRVEALRCGVSRRARLVAPPDRRPIRAFTASLRRATLGRVESRSASPMRQPGAVR